MAPRFALPIAPRHEFALPVAPGHEHHVGACACDEACASEVGGVRTAHVHGRAHGQVLGVCRVRTPSGYTQDVHWDMPNWWLVYNGAHNAYSRDYLESR